MPKALTEGFHRHSIADGIMRADNIRPYLVDIDSILLVADF